MIPFCLILICQSLSVQAFYKSSNNHKFNIRLNLQCNLDDKISIARSFVTSGFGVSNEQLLVDDFTYRFRNKILTKSQYLTNYAKEQSAVKRAAPDIDYRPYGFSVDEQDSSKVVFKTRAIGSLQGALSFKGEVYLPNQKQFELPVQQYTVTVKDNKVVFHFFSNFIGYS